MYQENITGAGYLWLRWMNPIGRWAKEREAG